MPEGRGRPRIRVGDLDGADLELTSARSDTIDLGDHPFRVQPDARIGGDRVTVAIVQ